MLYIADFVRRASTDYILLEGVMHKKHTDEHTHTSREKYSHCCSTLCMQ